MQKHAVLVMDRNESINKLHIEYIQEGRIPKYLNGESGFHVYHVRMLTELILRKFSEKELLFSEEEIQKIALASSLHDIGKLQIPKGILDSPKRLSPVEYDIIKKHTVFGKTMINDAVSEKIDPQILSYACEIAYCHHERIDGTGYPEGLVGDEIPIWAQVVAIADAYDALTTSRNYKQAYSQDTALQMIANGMCGVFSEELVECLMQVVNDNTLAKLRSQILKNRAVLSETESAELKSILCVGNTSYLTKEFLEQTFPEGKVVVVGNTIRLGSKNIKTFESNSSSVKELFDTYEFDTIVYFSEELSYQLEGLGDEKNLQEVLKYAVQAKHKIKLLYLSSLIPIIEKENPDTLITVSKEQLCIEYGKKSELDVKIVRIPYLYSATYTKDYLYKIMDKICNGKKLILKEKEDDPMYFMAMEDLSDLMTRLFEDWKSGEGILNVGDEFDLTFADLAKKLHELCDCVTEFTGEQSGGEIQINNRTLKKQYGWFARISILEDLPIQYELYKEQRNDKGTTYFGRMRENLKKHRKIWGVCELVLLFILTEILIHITDSAVVFSIVDFRMAYIVIIALVHGLYFGLASAALSSLSWIMAKVLSGSMLLTIFYEPTNWLPFIYYFLIGGLCGYIKIRSDDKIRFGKEEIQLLEDKLSFTKELYADADREKKDLKKQIIGSKDSFGKIYDVARRLDTVELQNLYLQTIDVFETILENKSIAIYSINEEGTFGRLEVSSRDYMKFATRSISMESYTQVANGVMGGEIWRNTQLNPNLPMYAAGVMNEEKLALLIFIWQAVPEQQTLYYVNLFKILKDLVQMSLLRAMQYNQAVYEKQYVAGTGILHAEAFAQVLKRYKEMAEWKVSRYILLEIDVHQYTLQEADGLIEERIRKNDILGILDNGNLGLLLSQASEEDLDVILRRFFNLDMEIVVCR